MRYYKLLRPALLRFLSKHDGNNFDMQNLSNYSVYYKNLPQKSRLIEEPNLGLKSLQREVSDIIKKGLKLPDYAYSLSGGKHAVKNAMAHQHNMYVVTLDISGFYPNTKEKYVKIFYHDILQLPDHAVEKLIMLTTFNGHLPTGAPSSPILAFLVHKNIFDNIYERMHEAGIVFTLYVDDITLSASKPIGNGAIKNCLNILKQHNLWLNSKKIKRFSYKKAHITGVIKNQANQLIVPNRKSHDVIKLLKKKEIREMQEKDLQILLGKISFIQQISPKKFAVTKDKLIKRGKQINRQKKHICNILRTS